MRKLAAILLILCPTTVTLWTAADAAHAQVGIAHGFHVGPTAPALHVGRAYYRPGSGHSAQTAQDYADSVIQDTLEASLAPKHAREKLSKARCDQLRADYVGRHGMTTPRPLRGLHGCAKYASDSAYWRHRRGESPNVPSGPLSAIGAQVSQALRGPLTVSPWG